MPILQEGTAVKFEQPIINGVITKAIISDATAVQYLVEYTNDEGDVCERYFREEEIVVV